MDPNGFHGLQGPDDEIPLVDRVNTEPPILKGLSSTESLWAIGLAFAVWVPIGALSGVLFSSLAAGRMQRVKRDRPDHYYIHLAQRWCVRYGVARARFITHVGRWDMGRSLLQRAQRVKR